MDGTKTILSILNTAHGCLAGVARQVLGGEGSIILAGANERGHPLAGCGRVCGCGGRDIGLGILAYRPVGVLLGEGECGIEIRLYTDGI